MLTLKQTTILRTIENAGRALSPTEIGLDNNRTIDATAWSCQCLPALVNAKLVKRREFLVKGEKRKRVEYSLMAKGRKALGTNRLTPANKEI